MRESRPSHAFTLLSDRLSCDGTVDACETACGCPGERLEPNDTFELASPVTSGTEAWLSLSHRDRDLFAIEVQLNVGEAVDYEVVFEVSAE